MAKKRNPQERAQAVPAGHKASPGPGAGGKQRARLIRRISASGVITAADAFESRRFDELTKQELYERARRANIEGRSGMTKEQLVNALRRG